MGWSYTTYGDLHGSAEITLGPGFNKNNVSRCTMYLQLKSSYGSLTTVSQDCTLQARYPNSNTVEVYRDWGSGGRSGDRYTQYVWMDVLSTTGAKYYTSKYYASVTITKP